MVEQYRGRGFRSGGPRAITDLLFEDEASITTDGETATSAAVYVGASGVFSIHLIKNSGTLDLDIEYLVCSTEDGTYLTPGAASNIVTGATASDIIGFSPELAPFMKIKVTGSTSVVNADFDLYLIHQ